MIMMTKVPKVRFPEKGSRIFYPSGDDDDSGDDGGDDNDDKERLQQLSSGRYPLE